MRVREGTSRDWMNQRAIYPEERWLMDRDRVRAAEWITENRDRGNLKGKKCRTLAGTNNTPSQEVPPKATD